MKSKLLKKIRSRYKIGINNKNEYCLVSDKYKYAEAFTKFADFVTEILCYVDIGYAQYELWNKRAKVRNKAKRDQLTKYNQVKESLIR